MSKNLIILVIILVILAGGAFYFYSSNNIPFNFSLNSDKADVNQMTGDPVEDDLIIEIDEDMAIEMKNMVYQYEGILEDVTTGEVRGINTKAETGGVAKSNYDGNEYILLATFENLPEPNEDDFYEGWVVQEEPFMFISTGIVNKVDGIYTNAYKSGEDLTNYDLYVLTIEPNDGDPAPADHVLDGTMVIIKN